MTDTVSRFSKVLHVIKRKWFRPAIYTLATSFLLYVGISSIVTQRTMVKQDAPHFLISRISDAYDETEFTHLLLTIQEIKAIPHISTMLKDFANARFPAPCPNLLQYQLNRMNWEPQAFLIRVKKLFKMYDAYDRILRLNETITFLETELEENRLPKAIQSQVDVLKEERDNLVKTELPENEYKFMEQYSGLIQQLKNEDKDED